MASTAIAVAMLWAVPQARGESATAVAAVATECCIEASRDEAAVLFSAARIVPQDVSFFVHVEDAIAIRERHGGQLLAEVLEQAVRGSTAAEAWAMLATRAGTTPARLFETVLGGRATLVGRTAADGGRGSDGRSALEWAMILEIDRGAFKTLVRNWRLERLWLRDVSVESWRFREADVRTYLLPGAIVVGGHAAPRLAEEVARRLHAAGGRVPRGHGGLPSPSEAAVGRSLWSHEGPRAGRELGAGSIAVWLSHGDDRGGGWSAVVIDALPEAVDRVRLAVHSAFEGSPFERPLPQASWSPGVVDAVAETAIAVFAEPTDIGWGRTGAWLSRVIGQPLLSPQLREILGDRRLFIVGEVDGRRLDPPFEGTVPTLGVAIETSEPEAAVLELDLHVAAILQEAGLSAGAATPHRTIMLNGTGLAEIGPAVSEWWSGGDAASSRRISPAIAAADLAWGVATGPDAGWIVLASNESHLRAILRSLERAAAGPADHDAFAWFGVVHGQRASVHLAELAEAAGRAEWSPDPRTLADTLETAAEILATADRVRCGVRRPDAQSVRLDVEIELAPPPTVTVRRGGG